MELATGEIIINNRFAFDVFGNYYTAEPNLGEVGLYERGKGIVAVVSLHSN